MKKKICCMLALVMSVSLFAGCQRTPGEEQEPIDKEKTQLYIGCTDGGYGTEYLYKLKERFEEKHKNDSFQDGKIGVQIYIEKKKSYEGTTLTNTMHTLSPDVYFVECLQPYHNMITDNLLVDITDAVMTPLTEYGETESIADKMYDLYKGWYQTSDNKYYGVPNYNATNGFIYDAALFEKESKPLYFAKGGCPSEYLRPTTCKDAPLSGAFSSYQYTAKGEKSAGRDGEYGTSDDGLPATYEEFFELCDHMVNVGVMPFTWSGASQVYVLNMMNILWADYEGPEQTMLNYTFNGTAKHLIKDINDGVITTESKNITEENGYEMFRQEGRYHAIDFMEKIIRGASYYNATDCFSSTQSFAKAQDTYIYSMIKAGRKPIAFLVDGSWWLNEAKGTFYDEGIDINDKNYGFLPIPKVSNEQIGQDSTYVDLNYAGVVVSKTIDDSKIDLAKQFIRFCHTDESLKEFNMLTGATKPYDYDLEDAQYEALTSFGQSLYDISKNATWILPAANNRIFRAGYNDFTTTSNMWQTSINGTKYYSPIRVFKDYSYSAQDYFEGMQVTFGKSYWNEKYN